MEDLSKEVKQLRKALEELSSRLTAVEKKLGEQTPTEKQPVQSSAEAKQSYLYGDTDSQSVVAAVEKPRESLETKIGLYWLNRLGIGLLILGVVFGILYTFQYFGAAAKILTGYAIGAVMLAGGEWLAKKEKLNWFGRNLTGGAWALTYFTTYAAYHVESVRVIHSVILDLCLLLVVAACVVGHSIKRDSENIGLLAVVLGFITVALSPASAFTTISLALLLGVVAWLVIKKGWSKLYLYSVVSAYSAYLFALSDSLTAGTIIDSFWLKAGFLTVFWLVFNAISLALTDNDPNTHKSLLASVLVNNFAYTVGFLGAMESLPTRMEYVFFLLAGTAAIGWAYISRRMGLTAPSRIHLLTALSLITAGITTKASEQWISLIWAAEIAVFASQGLKYNLKSFRWFAMIMSVLMLLRFLTQDVDSSQVLTIGQLILPWTQFIGYFCVFCFDIAGIYYKLPSLYAYQSKFEQRYFHYTYFAIAAFIAWLLPLDANAKMWLAFTWALQALFALTLGSILVSRYLRTIAALFFACSFLAYIATADRLNALVAFFVVAMFFAASFVYRRLSPRLSAQPIKRIAAAHNWYAGVGILLLTIFLAIELPDQMVSFGWALEGLALLTIGFRLSDKVFRVAGLAVFAVLLVKLLFFDMAQAEFVYRVLSFIAAGIIILLGNYIYWRFAGKEEERKT